MSSRTRLLVVFISAVLFLVTLTPASKAVRPILSTLLKSSDVRPNKPANNSLSNAPIFAPLTSYVSARWYNGDSVPTTALPNGMGFTSSNQRIFSDFQVIEAGGWEVSALLSNNLMNATITTASYEIRTGVTTGSGGILRFSGTAAATQVATGRTLSGLTEYTVMVSGLNIHLDPGVYYLNVAPVGSGTGASYNTATTGTNAVGTPPGNNGNDYVNNGSGFVLTSTTGQGNDFSNGVIGNVTVACVTPAITYVDDDWVGTPIGNDPDGAGPATYFGCDSFATIQGGVNGVATGGQVMVAAGTYNEAQIQILRAMSVTGAGAAATTINGGNTAIPVAGLVRIVTPLGDTGSVNLSGFTITNPGLSGETGGTHVTVYARPRDPAATTTVSNNTILGVNASDNGVYTIRNVGSVVYHHNVFINQGFNPIVIERSEGPTDVHHNTISANASAAYFNFTYAGTNVTSLQRVADNIIDGSTASAIAFNSAYPAAPPFTGTFTNISIVNNVITQLTAAKVGITLLNRAVAGSGPAGDIQNAVITGNIITGTDAAGSRGIRLAGLVTSASITTNDVRHLERSFSGEIFNDHSPKGTQAHFNNFVNNSGGFVWDGTESLTAENNWWGCNAGPGNSGCDSVRGVVGFDPWIVLGVTASPNPTTPGGTSLVTADMTHNSQSADTSGLGTVPLTPVSFTATEGTISPSNGTITSGQATATFTSTSNNNGTGCATVDGELVCTTIVIALSGFTIDDVTNNEGDAGTTSFTFTITKNGTTTFNTSVDYATVDGTATSPSDFTAIPPTTLTFLPGDTSMQVTVFVNGDLSVEPTEAFTVHLSNPSGATISDADGTGTITNDDACATFATVYVDDDWVGTTFGSDPDGAGPATSFGCDSFATIQGGVDGVTTGGQVIVADGTYNEAQILIVRSMSVTGAGAATTIINGGNAALKAAGLVRIVTPFGDTGSVTFSGFTITNPGLSSETGGTHVTVYARPLDAAATTTVFNNTILGVNASDNGVYTIRNVGSVVYHHNVFINQGFNPIVIERSEGPTDVHHNTISANGFTAYFNFTYAGTNVTSLQRVADNIIDGSTASAIGFSSAYPAAPPFVGTFTNIAILNNNITGLATNRLGITLSNRAAAGAGPTGTIDNPVISGNIITGTDAEGSRGITLRGLVTNATITSNDVRNLERGFSGEIFADHSPTGTQAHFNSFVNNSGGFVWNGPESLNAENNWWGCNAGPGNAGCDSVKGIVAFDPWLVLGVSASPNPALAFGTSNVTADMTDNSAGADTSALGTVPLTPVTFTATEGTMTPPTGTITAGQASSTFTSTSNNNGTACATVDSQLVCTDVTVVSPADISGTKTKSGGTAPGSTVTYTVVLSNSSTSSQLDNPGDEFADLLPSSLTLVSASASSGTASANGGTNTVTWNGSIAASGSVTITINATINSVPDGTLVSNQGMINYDADGNGTNESIRATDDPATRPAGDPTVFTTTDVNDAPDAVDDSLASVAEDSGVRTIPIASLLANDSTGPANESGQTLTLTGVSNAVGGTVSNDATNVYFTPTDDFNGAASFQYTITDNGTTDGAADPKSDTATASFTVTEVNDAPDAVDDSLSSVAEDSGVRTIPIASLLANDSTGPANESGQTLTLTGVSNAVGGTVSNDATNVYFTPTADFNGAASFEYTITDDGTTNGVADPRADTATVSFTVTEVNDAPDAVDDPLSSVAEDSGVRTIPIASLLANDTTGPANESGQTLTLTGVSNPVGGTVTSDATNVYFTPTADFNGAASFEYTITDDGTTDGLADPKSDTATVSFTVTEVNDAPDAVDDSLSSVAEDSGVRTIPIASLLANDTTGPANESGQTLTLTGVSNPVGGTVTNDATYVYFTPTPDFNGAASFQYTITDDGTTNGLADPQTDTATVSFTITDVNEPVVLTFSSSNYTVSENTGFIDITVTRTGDPTLPVTVDYASSDTGSTATERKDYTTAIGTLKFAAGETSRTFTLLVEADSAAEGDETVQLTLSNPTGGAALGVPQNATVQLEDSPSPLADALSNTRNFVRRHYHDFLNREPDAAGWDFWTSQITDCGSDAECIESKRVNVSAAFFLSVEFQETGFFAVRSQRVAFGRRSDTAGTRLTYEELLRDTRQLGEGVIIPDTTRLESNREVYAQETVSSPAFAARFPQMTAADYVDALYSSAEVTPVGSERQDAIDAYDNAAGGDTEKRVAGFRKVTDSTSVRNAEFRAAFVMMEYYGYLRRTPDEAGYAFWLAKLNKSNGDFVEAEMVKSFILSGEYRGRYISEERTPTAALRQRVR